MSIVGLFGAFAAYYTFFLGSIFYVRLMVQMAYFAGTFPRFGDCAGGAMFAFAAVCIHKLVHGLCFVAAVISFSLRHWLGRE